MDPLEHIKRPVIDELSLLRSEFESSLQHSNPLLDSGLKFVSSRTGKMMRPILTLLAAKLFGEVNKSTICAGCCFEFFHTASLLHDDVVDESNERRGQSSVNGAYTNKIAILVGDYILSLALSSASKSGYSKLIDILSITAQNLADGELLQLDYTHQTSLSEDIYFRIIKKKTASLFAACSEAGAYTCGASIDDVNRLRSFGEMVGICFQIKDDIFDYFDDESIGKPTGNDMREGKLTLPVIYALRSTNNTEMLDIANAVRKGEATDSNINRLVSFAKENNGIKYAEEVMNKYAIKAKELLEVYPESDIKQSLLSYVNYVVTRTI